MTVEFKPWQKTPRLFRDIVITEKIDGTNSAIHILDDGTIVAQSRNRLISPEKTKDNYGFARWANDNSEELIDILGPGVHFGEWWGLGIQRDYGLDEKRFSLFNVSRYGDMLLPKGVFTVPVIYEGPFSTDAVNEAVEELRTNGSHASPGFNNPEGVVVFHTASNMVFKVTLDNDELPKSKVAK